MIKLDNNGKIEEIRVGNFLRVPLQIDFDLIEPMYKAYKLLETLNHDDRFKLRFRLEQGECLIIDNRRILHARDSFDSSTGERSAMSVSIIFAGSGFCFVALLRVVTFCVESFLFKLFRLGDCLFRIVCPSAEACSLFISSLLIV